MNKEKKEMSNSEKEYLTQDYETYTRELHEYRNRAKNIGYKQDLPKLPKREQRPELMRSTIIGFIKRFSNWKNNFYEYERGKINEK